MQYYRKEEVVYEATRSIARNYYFARYRRLRLGRRPSSSWRILWWLPGWISVSELWARRISRSGLSFSNDQSPNRCSPTWRKVWPPQPIAELQSWPRLGSRFSRDTSLSTTLGIMASQASDKATGSWGASGR